MQSWSFSTRPATSSRSPVGWCRRDLQRQLGRRFAGCRRSRQWPGARFVIRGAGIVGIRSIDAFVESSEDVGGLGGWHVEKAAPDFGRGETTGCEARDDTEIVGAAFEGAPEIGIGRCGGDDDRA